MKRIHDGGYMLDIRFEALAVSLKGVDRRQSKTWTEQVESIRARAVLTERAGRDICVRVGRNGASVTEMAREFLVAWSTAMAGVEVHGRPLVDDPERIGRCRRAGCG
jgi:hypothetical protein